jgi:tetratricopeptide (TPR) repeat protein
VPTAPPGFVDVVRDFLTAHRELRRLVALFRAGSLRFEDLDPIFVDDERSVLFRLKERCHALFRPRGGPRRDAPERGLLFDLVVGSLFHEAMKFRENFYQREVYGPQVRALRGQAHEGADALFEEFEKILGAVSARLGEGVEEVETLLARTCSQLALLLARHADDGLVMRCLIEHPDLVEEAFGESLDGLLTRLQHGDAARGFELAGRAYLESGHYAEAERAFAEAARRGGDAALMERQAAYARGMRAYLSGDYARSVEQLEVWASQATAADAFLAGLAHAAVSRLDRLLQANERAEVLPPAGALVERLSALRAPAAAPAR